MIIFKSVFKNISAYIPALVFFLLFVIFFTAVLKLLRKKKHIGESKIYYQLFLSTMVLVFFIVMIMIFPLGQSERSQLLGLIGILLSGAIALSSTTFLGNAMAGLMLRALNNFKAGDFLRIKGEFGRVTERGLLHIELQTEMSDLVTLPNLYLITNPFSIIKSSGTIICAEVSLGYDVSRKEIEEGLLEAAGLLELEECFVRVLNLGDYSVNYQVAGYLRDIKHLISKRSALKKYILDCLHKRNIEIVSPSFMNQRRLADGYQAIPKIKVSRDESIKLEEDAEDIIFEKAEMAENIERLKEKKDSFAEELVSAKGNDKIKLNRKINILEKLIERKESSQED